MNCFNGGFVPEVTRKKETVLDRQRVIVEFSPKAYAQLLGIKSLTGSSSNAEVIREAIRLYNWFLQQKHDNFKLQLVKGDIVNEVDLFLL